LLFRHDPVTKHRTHRMRSSNSDARTKCTHHHQNSMTRDDAKCDGHAENGDDQERWCEFHQLMSTPACAWREYLRSKSHPGAISSKRRLIRRFEHSELTYHLGTAGTLGCRPELSLVGIGPQSNRTCDKRPSPSSKSQRYTENRQQGTPVGRVTDQFEVSIPILSNIPRIVSLPSIAGAKHRRV